MNNELIAQLSFIERDRGIDRQTLISVVEDALKQAAESVYKRRDEAAKDYDVKIDPKTCEISVYEVYTVSDAIKSPKFMSVEQAQQHKPDAANGDIIRVKTVPKDFGRIAATIARQTILAKIRQAEREKIAEEYKARVGSIVTGVVRQRLKGEYYIDLDNGRAEGIIPSPTEEVIEGRFDADGRPVKRKVIYRATQDEFKVGDTIRAHMVRIEPNSNKPSIILSRASNEFLKALFALEVSEIAEGIVEIMSIAREPGFRSKVAVHSRDPKVDAIGACVGINGSRVKSILGEVGRHEKIDIVEWNQDFLTFVKNSIAPASALDIYYTDDDHARVEIIVPDEQYSVAIGKKGQNVALAGRLTGCRLTITCPERVARVSFEEAKSKAVDEMSEALGLDRDTAELIYTNGFISIEMIAEGSLEDFSIGCGLDDPQAAAAIYNTARKIAAGEKSSDTEAQEGGAEERAGDTEAQESAAEAQDGEAETPEGEAEAQEPTENQ